MGIKNVLWDKVSSERAEVHNPDKTILLTGELEKNNMKVNISMKHVRGNVKFNRVMIPRIVRDLKILHPYRLQHHMVMNYAQEPLNGRNINQCKSLRNDSIITFDGVMFNYDQSMCDHILAKDCSVKERFVVLSRKLSQTSPKKVVTVYVDNTRMDLPPLTKIVIEDDVKRTVPMEMPTVHIMDLEKGGETPREPHTFTSHERKHRTWDMPESSSSEEVQMSNEEMKYWEALKDHVKMDIAAEPQTLPVKPKTQIQIVRTKLGDSIMLFALQQELKVFTDGYNVKVELPQKYKNVQCGLCGDFNGEVSDEFSGPQRELYMNPRRFGRSFQHTTQECAESNQCAPAMEFAFDTEVSLPGNRNQFACITKKPVPHCLPTCTPVQEENVDVEFVCIEHEGSSDPFTTYSRMKVIQKYNPKKPDYKRTMLMANKCVRDQ